MGNQTSRFSTLRLSSISEYLEHANRLRDEWEAGKEQEYLSSPWFRGVPNRAYDLVPSYHRFAQVYPRTTEDDLRDEFVRRAYPLLDRSRPADHWEWYFLMQHYSLPTRLLDWSVSSLVGLFFAVYDGAMLKGDWTKQMDQPPEYNAAVWMMDAEVLNKDTLQSSFTRDEPIPRYDHPSLVARYLNPRPFDPPDWPEKPLAILPAYTNHAWWHKKEHSCCSGSRPARCKGGWTGVWMASPIWLNSSSQEKKCRSFGGVSSMPGSLPRHYSLNWGC